MKYAVLGLAILSSCPDNSPVSPSGAYIVQVEGTSHWSGTIGTRHVIGQHNMAFTIPNTNVCWTFTQVGNGQLKAFATLPTYTPPQKLIFPKWGYAESNIDGTSISGCFVSK